MDFSDKNIFQMYVANGNQPGFWLKRTTWANTCAKVVSVGELKGPAPYFCNPAVMADIYDLATGGVKERGSRLSAATYKTWRQIEPPPWAQ